MKDPNKSRRPIDIKRESAGSFSIDEPEGKIEGVLIVDDKMVIVSKKAVYQSQLADQIDPDRTDINLPQMIQQKVLDYGTDATFIVQTLLTAKELFDTTHLGSSFQKDEALSLALKAAREFAAAADIVASFTGDQKAAIEKLDTAIKGSSLSLPTVPNLDSRVSSFLNHLRNACLAVIAIVKLFHPKAKSNDGWRAAFDKGTSEFLKQNEPFRETADFLCRYIENMSNLRNAVEHPDKSKHAAITDFRILPGSIVAKPRLAITFKGKKIVDSDIDHFMDLFMNKTGEVFEDMCALLCDANIVPFGPIETRVVSEQPDGSTGPRRYKYVSKFKEGFEPPGSASG